MATTTKEKKSAPKRECAECGVSGLEAHLEYIKEENFYLCDYCLASSDYEDYKSEEEEYEEEEADDDYGQDDYGGGGRYDDRDDY